MSSGVVAPHGGGGKKKTKHRTKVANIVLSAKRPVAQPSAGISNSSKVNEFKYSSKYLLSSTAPKYKINGKFLRFRLVFKNIATKPKTAIMSAGTKVVRRKQKTGNKGVSRPLKY